jgi:MFS family permease
VKKFNLLFVLIGAIFGAYFSLWQPQILGRGFTVSDLAALMTVLTVTTVLVDIPSGYFSDRLGHKFTTLCGFFFYAVGFACPALNSSSLALAGGVVLIGTGASIVNGALDSWVSDIQEAETGALSVRHYLTRDQLQRIGMILGALAIPGLITIFRLGESALWLPLFLCSLVLFGFAARLPPGLPKNRHSLKGKLNIFSILAAAPVVFLCAFFFGASNGCMDVALWARFKGLGLSTPILFGMIQAGFSISRVAGLSFWKFAGIGDARKLAAMSLLSSSVFFAAFPFVNLPSLAAGLWFVRIALLSSVFGAMNSLVLHRFRDANLGATALSVYSVVCAVGSGVATLSIASIGKALDLRELLVFGAFSSAVAGIALCKRLPVDLI